jgi:glycosyltransferase involved in cell wall biosynthesis
MDNKLNILMCCYLPLKPTLGGAKGYLEVAQNYRNLGHNVELVGIEEIVGLDQPYMDEGWRVLYFPQKLKEYLLKHGNRFDVVEYESIYLPFSMKKELKCILAVRCSLLDVHLQNIVIPRFFGPRALVGFLLKSLHRKIKLNKKIKQSLISMSYADFVNVQNPTDQKALIKYGIDSKKIIVQPLGLFQEKINQFDYIRSLKENNSKKKIIAFIGTFDNRKGAIEFPKIIKKILDSHPNVEFKLLGVVGMFPSEESIYHYIGNEFRQRLHIRGRFSQEELPELLNDCTYGIFPSYLESFGYGVLEMMAMGLPVVGYNSPGIDMLLLKELTVSPGNVDELVAVF